MNDRAVILSPSVTLNLPRPLVESPREPWIDLYGVFGPDRVNVFNAHCVSRSNRKRNSVELMRGVERRLLGYDEAISNGSKDSSSGRIGGAHAHSISRKPIPSKGDIETSMDSMKKYGLEEWLEIIMEHQRFRPREYERYTKKGVIYTRHERRPRLRIVNATRRLGLEVTFYGYVISMNGSQRVEEVPIYFDGRVLKRFIKPY